MDLGFYKNFALPSNMRLQVRIEAINALNYAVLWNPGVDPRNAQFGLVNPGPEQPEGYSARLEAHLLKGKRDKG
jgi:hypothetical protein